MTLPQLIDAATSPLAILIATAILAVVIQPWLAAHRAQVQALTASIKDSHLRMAAETVVRWLETDPAMAQLPGLIQRANGITLLAKRTGLPESTVATYLDAGYNYLKGSGQLLVAPTPPTPTVSGPSTLAELAALLAPLLSPPRPLVPPAPSPAPTTLDAERQAEEVRADIAASTADFGVLDQEATAATGGAVEPVPAVLPGAGG